MGPRSAYGASVSGEIKVAGGKKLKNLIVFLELVNEKTVPAVDEKVVSQKGRIFDPRVTVIVAGGKIVFHNNEERNIDHNVYSLSRTRKFDIGLAGKDSKLTVDFPKPGIVKYYCSVHKNMEGTIVVLPSPYYAIVDEPGPFTIENVPAGEWKLNASISHHRYAVDPVDVAITDAPVENLSLHVVKKKRR